ncbi:hypothetical protein IFM89_025785 [Coptis chinensis]|uniref:Single-stranded DNA binding protein Ssb-like OB fold domain-containing protein n=1 Tax=Coptis chinensis TaxID=261450 RepID=A0A835HJS9_9MAGN|nr:hypothetical protein IFM89_025785 [Coptis chinensis]
MNEMKSSLANVMGVLKVHPNEFVFPPIRQRQPGRPRVNRRRGEDQTVNTTRCSRCGIFGHNVRSCQNEEAGTIRERGRGGRSGRPRTRLISNTLHRPINPETEDLSSVMGRDNTSERAPSGRAKRGVNSKRQSISQHLHPVLVGGEEGAEQVEHVELEAEEDQCLLRKSVLQKGRVASQHLRHTRIAECLVGDETCTIVFTARNGSGLVYKHGIVFI